MSSFASSAEAEKIDMRVELAQNCWHSSVVERRFRTADAVGSIPTVSTNAKIKS
jgi:hypothetical protein